MGVFWAFFRGAKDDNLPKVLFHRRPDLGAEDESALIFQAADPPGPMITSPR
jgi:hypothetical protein